jgi:predicted protein tyrosine phosphatase
MISVHIYPEMAVVDQNFLDHLVISIVSPGREHPNIVGSNVHQFHFHDVTQDYMVDSGIINAMTKEVAEAIVHVVMESLDKGCERWIIHCEAGISRSPGVAIGLAKYIDLRPGRRRLREMFPFYNKHVCRMIEEAMEIKMKELEKLLPPPGCDGFEGF